MEGLAPVVIFTYKRLPILIRVLESLRANPESPATHLIVYSDGPKTPGDVAAVEEVRAYLNKLAGFDGVELRFREKNFGLARSFIDGISTTLHKYESAIFLEDDNLLSPHFLRFMNNSLARFANDDRVICVTGYSFPIWPRLGKPYFVRGAETWSMATWRRGWARFQEDGSALKREIDVQKLGHKLNFSGFGFYEMLERQINGQIDSWGVRWWVSAFVNNLYCLYPNEPLCVSIGYGEDSVHCPTYSPLFRLPSDLSQRPVGEWPGSIEGSVPIDFLLRLMNVRLSVQRKVASLARRWQGLWQ